MRIDLDVNRRRAPLIYLALAFAVAAPLLGTGLVLAVDLAQTPHPGIPTAYWGIPEGTHVGPPARLPLDAVFAALGEIDAVWVGQKLMLLAIVFLAGLGMHRLVPVQTERARVFAGFLYAVNPFVYDRLYTGQWFLLLGYALLPHAYLAFLRALECRRLAPFAFGALFLATGIASTHIAAFLFLLCAVTLLAHLGARQRTRRLRPGLAALGLGLLPSLYWLVPTPGVEELWRNVGGGQLELYRTVADHDWGLGPTVAGLYGYWNNVEPIKSHFSAWPLLALTLLVLAAWGVALRRRDPVTLAVAVTGLAGFLLALGDASFLTRDTYTWLLDNFSFLRSFREPQKGVALLVLAYAFLGAIAVDDLLRNPPRLRAAAHVLSALVLAFPLMYGYRVLGGLWGKLQTSDFPASWEEADRQLSAEAADSRTLFLPWHGYFALNFAHGRVVVNPAPSFFGSPILASRSVGGGEVSDESDPVEREVTRLLTGAANRPDFARCLARLGVSHVLLARVADWEQYAFLGRRRDVVLERRWPDLVLYRLRSPGGLVMKERGVSTSGCAQVAPLAIVKNSQVRYTIGGPSLERSQVALGLPQARDWKLGGNEVAFKPWTTYRRNYLLGLAGLAGFLGILFRVLRRRS